VQVIDDQDEGPYVRKAGPQITGIR